MISEVKVLEHVDYVVRGMGLLILLPEVVQDPYFYEGLVMKPLFVSTNE